MKLFFLTPNNVIKKKHKKEICLMDSHMLKTIFQEKQINRN